MAATFQRADMYSSRSYPSYSVENEPPSKRRKISTEPAAAKISTELGLMRNQNGLDPPSFVGSASGIYFVRSVYSALANGSGWREASSETPQSSAVPGEEDQLQDNPAAHASRFLWCQDEVDNSDTETVGSEFTGNFNFNDFVSWSRMYFDNWHPSFPFLHAPTVLKCFEALCKHGLQTMRPLELIIIRSIISIGIVDSRQMNDRHSKPVPSILTFTSFQQAMDSMQAALSTRASILSLQAAVSVQLFLTSMLRLNSATRLGGLIVKMAHQLGLHRCPVRYPAFSPQEAQIRSRLFWSIYCLDRFLCQALGLPLSIQDDDLDICFPGEERHQQSPSSTPDAQDERFRLLCFLSKYAYIRGLIVELRNKNILERIEDSDQVTLINARINKLGNEIQDYLYEDSPETLDAYGTPHAQENTRREKKMSKLHETILEVLKYESIISLNRPMIASPRESAAYSAAIQACISASKSIITVLRRAMKATRAAESNSTRSSGASISLIWPSFSWAVWMSAFILIYAAAESEVAVDVALR